MTAPAAGLAALALASLFSTAAHDCNFRIQAGKHDSTLFGIRAPQLGWHLDRTVSFHAVFHGDVPYATRAPSNQWDWNKLMGISLDNIHNNSVRLGWRWRPDLKKVEVALYAYQDGVRTMEPITTVALETPLAVELRLWEGGASVRAGGQYLEHRASLGLAGWVPRLSWRLETAYFGGDETAPHELHLSAFAVRD